MILQQGSNCRFIGWVDPVMRSRSRDIVPGLLRSKNKLEGYIEEKKKENRMLKCLLLISWVSYFVFFFSS